MSAWIRMIGTAVLTATAVGIVACSTTARDPGNDTSEGGASDVEGGSSSSSSGGGSSSGDAYAGSTQGSLNGSGAFQPSFVGSNLAHRVDDHNLLYDALYVTFFDADLSASWSAICSSVGPTMIPGSGKYLQLELLTPFGEPFPTGVFPVGSQFDGLYNNLAKVSGGTAATPGTRSATSGQVTLTHVTSDGSASGSFSVQVGGSAGGGTLSGTFAATLGCAADLPDGGVGSDAGCSTSSGAGQYEACTTSSGCLCPDDCTNDPYLHPAVSSNVCEQPCQTSADCTDLATFCQNGFCHLSPCGPTQNNANDACTTGDGQPGSCEDYNYDTVNEPFAAIWTCDLAGSVRSDQRPARASYSARCVPGYTCDSDNGYDQCVPLCDPSAADSCTNGYACNRSSLASETGFCGP